MDVPMVYRQSATKHFEQPKRSLRRLAVELFGYGIASAVALGVDAGILKALVSLAGWHYLVAATVSFIAGAVVAYILSVKLAFGSRRVTNRSLELLAFVVLGIAGLLVNAVVISVCVSSIGMTVLKAKLVAAVFTFLTNFVLRKSLLFAPNRVTP